MQLFFYDNEQEQDTVNQGNDEIQGDKKKPEKMDICIQ